MDKRFVWRLINVVHDTEVESPGSSADYSDDSSDINQRTPKFATTPKPSRHEDSEEGSFDDDDSKPLKRKRLHFNDPVMKEKSQNSSSKDTKKSPSSSKNSTLVAPEGFETWRKRCQWLRDDQLFYLITAFLGMRVTPEEPVTFDANQDLRYVYPCSYDILTTRLEKKGRPRQRVAKATEKAKEKAKETYEIGVLNVTPAAPMDFKGSNGKHWIVAVVVYEAKTGCLVRIHLYDPLHGLKLSKPVKREMEKRLNVDVQLTSLKVQQDGWKCGYFCLYAMVRQLATCVKAGEEPKLSVSDIPPPGWLPMVFRLLQLYVKLGKDHVLDATSLGVSLIFRNMCETGNMDAYVDAYQQHIDGYFTKHEQEISQERQKGLEQKSQRSQKSARRR